MLDLTQNGVQFAVVTPGASGAGLANGQCVRFGNAGDTSNRWQWCCGLWAPSAGNIVVVDENGQTVTITVPANAGIIPLRICRVLSTTCTGVILALFPKQQ